MENSSSRKQLSLIFCFKIRRGIPGRADESTSNGRACRGLPTRSCLYRCIIITRYATSDTQRTSTCRSLSFSFSVARSSLQLCCQERERRDCCCEPFAFIVYIADWCEESSKYIYNDLGSIDCRFTERLQWTLVLRFFFQLIVAEFISGSPKIDHRAFSLLLQKLFASV